MSYDRAPESPQAVLEGRGRSQLGGTAILTVTMLGVSAGNYLLNLALAQMLPPAEFGDANLAVNLVLIAAAVAATLQLVTARSVAADPARSVEVGRKLSRAAWAIGLTVGAALALVCVPLAELLGTSEPVMFVIIGAGLPVYFAQAVRRGRLQGETRIGRLAVSYAIETATRLVIAVAAVAAGYGVIGAAVAISLSFVASALVAGRGRTLAPGAGAEVASRSEPSNVSLSAVSMAASVLLVAQVLIANGDVLLAKAKLSPTEAGGYAAAAVIGRAIFFLSWAIVHATFPHVARAGLSPDERRQIVRRALGLVCALSVLGVAGLAVLGERTAEILLGSQYADSAQLLVGYSIATSCFALGNLLASVDLAAGRLAGPVALLTGAALQCALLLTMGSTPPMMVRAQVIAMVVTLALCALAHVWSERLDHRSWTPEDQCPRPTAVRSA